MIPLTDATLPEAEATPILDASIRLRLGRQLQALYDPMLDEALDPQLAALIQQLDADERDAGS